MSSFELAGRDVVPSCDIVTKAKDFPLDPKTNKKKIHKTSTVTFHSVDPTTKADAKVAFLIQDHQEVELFRVVSPHLDVVSDSTVADEATEVFGAEPGKSKWVGFLVTQPGAGNWPATLETEFTLNPFHQKPKHIQLIPVMFTFAVDQYGKDFDKHFLTGVSTCTGSGIAFHIETRTVFVS